jgi:uncharacterized protein YqeY
LKSLKLADLTNEIQSALKAGSRERVSSLRLLSTAIRNAEVAKGGHLTDQEAIEVAGREVRKREEAAGEYERAGRADRAGAERAEAEILREFLPDPLSPQELDALVTEAIAAAGASGPGDMGKVMGALMPKVRGRADGKEVSELVRKRLA